MNAACRPEFVVFYAWQSDRPGNRTRYLIQEAAAAAAQEINGDETSPYSVRIDQDTQGVPGLCDIPATILEKIDSADAFLCDLTYVATTQADADGDDEFVQRFCSNPNVLFELGYAFQSMGFERLICTMNEHYGPATEQIFDLAHRRFPIRFRYPNLPKSKKGVSKKLATDLANAIRQLFPLGRRADSTVGDRVLDVRNQFEGAVRDGEFHRLVRRKGALAIAIVPALGQRIPPRVLRAQHFPPPGRSGWNTEIRGNCILSVDPRHDDRSSVAEIRNDGTILAADTFVLDPAYHPNKELWVPSVAIETAIITSIAQYLKVLQAIGANLPWHVCISLLEIKGYHFLISNSESSRDGFIESNILIEPLIVRSVSEVDSPHKIAHSLRPAIDFIWREFGLDGSYNYTEDGTYTRRLFL